MTDSKMMQLTKPVLKPEWVLESIQQQKRLPELNYQLYKLDPRQNVISFKKTQREKVRFWLLPNS